MPRKVRFSLYLFLVSLTALTIFLGSRAQARPGLTVEQYNAASVKIEEAVAILYDRDGKP